MATVWNPNVANSKKVIKVGAPMPGKGYQLWTGGKASQAKATTSIKQAAAKKLRTAKKIGGSKPVSRFSSRVATPRKFKKLEPMERRVLTTKQIKDTKASTTLSEAGKNAIFEKDMRLRGKLGLPR